MVQQPTYNRFFSLLVLLGILIASCARMASPDGGAYDETPPVMVRSHPAIGAINSNEKRIVLEFDEYIKLQNASEKVIISPPQIDVPEIKTNGKRVIVELQDSLKPHTTYSIDFGDAITDNNEGNPMGQFAFTFSTGDAIDSMEVAGTILEASNLEPVKGMQVGLYADLSDTAFTTKPLERISRTDASGRFSIKGVAPGTYHIYGLKDSDQDYRFSQKSEMIAFFDTVVVPYSEPAIRKDTFWIDSLIIDTIIDVPYTRYLPDDLVLRAFKEEFSAQYLLKSERPTPNRFSIYFADKADTLPTLRGLNFDATDAFIIEKSLHNDTIHYWVKDSAIIRLDTLELTIDYLYTDTLGKLAPCTDTLLLASKKTLAAIQKDKEREMEEFQKELKKRRRRLKDGEELTDTLPPIKFLKSKLTSIKDVYATLTLTFDEPLARVDTQAIHLRLKVDTLWKDIPYRFEQMEGQIRKYRIRAEWRPEQEYELSIDSTAFTGIYGLHTDKIKQTMRMRSLDDYGTLAFDMTGGSSALSSHAYVELLNGSDKAVRREPIVKGHAEFFFLNPGKYYARIVDDANGNGKWDTGVFADHIQPEHVYYYPHVLEVRALWDMRQDWDITALPIEKQKPLDITKQKPEVKKERRSKNAEREERKRKNQ
ncbi:MAG: Ig-like domain-containing protein [Bacteroidaceae bacterium]|nr:Ig-like domain-containing protein [Bacteroidaceae bacterium]